jgi:drug/metabolite transporter (DMT)-like permease
MEAVRKLLVTIIMIIVSLMLSIVTMIFGWGVSPKSWGVIIGVGCVLQIFIMGVQAINMKH